MADYASEQTLQELLQQAQQMNSALTKLSNVLGKGSTSGSASDKGAKEAADNMKNLNTGVSKFLPTVTAVSGAFGILSVAIGGVSKIFGSLAGLVTGLFDKLGKVAGVLGEFAMVAASGNMKLSNMVDVMGDLAAQIPVVGGLFSALIAPMKMVIQRQEETLELFRKLSSVGAGVGESLETIRLNARSTGLTMEEYERVVSANGQVFATMGGDVQSGVKQFNKNMQAVMGDGSEVRKSFFGMGFTAEEAAASLTNYMKSQGSMNKQGLQDSKATAQSALEVAQQMQLLAETTGKSRKEIQNELDEAQKEKNWQAYVAGLGEKEAKEAMMKLNYALQKGGKDAGDMVKTGMMTGVWLPLTESQKKTDAILNGGLTDLSKGIGTASGSITDQQKQMAQSNAKYVKQYDQSIQDYGQISALQQATGKAGLLEATSVANRNRYLQDGKMKTEEQIVKEEMGVLAKIKNASTSDAAALADQTQNLREFGNIIDRIIGTLAGPLLGPILQLTESFQGISKTFAKELEPYVKEFGVFMAKWVTKFTEIKSWEEFKIVMFAFWEDIKKKTGPLLADLWESARPVLAEGFSKLIGFIWDAIKTAITPDWWNKLFGGKDEEKKKKEAEDAQKEIAKLKELKSKYEEKNPGKKWEDTNVGMLGADRMKKLESSAPGAESAPSSNNSQLIRDWAYSIMTGQAKTAPSSIAKQVEEVVKSPDATLKKAADDYNESVKQKAAEEKARQDKAIADAKAASNRPEEAKEAIATPAVSTPAPEPAADASTTLNSMVAQLIRINAETADATKRTASLIASNGNLFRRA